MSKIAPQVGHEAECTGHHCMDCGCCLLVDPTDEEAQALLGEDREKLSRCVGCLYAGTVAGEVLSRLSRASRAGRGR